MAHAQSVVETHRSVGSGPSGSFTADLVGVSAVYGTVGVVVGTNLPRLSAATVGAALLIALGVFLLVYRDVRVPSIFGIDWFPTTPHN